MSAMTSVLTKGKPSRFETPAIAIDGVLPTEVLSEVLLCLSAKELCRLRLVCRAWRALTSEPIFVKAHSTHHPLIAGLCNRGSGEIHIMDISGHAIRQRRTEEAIDSYELSTQFGRIFISGGITDYVLGYVPSTREYKVLCSTMCLMEGGAHKVFHVITLGRADGQWRQRADPPMSISGLSDQRAVINGVAYFLSNKDYNNTCAAGINIIMFDLVIEEWRQSVLQGPSSNAFSEAEKTVMKTDYMTYLQLVELNGCLVIVYSKWDDISVDLWFLVDMDKGLWTKRYSVCCSLTSWDECRLRPLVVLADGRIAFRGFYRRVLMAYDPKTSTWDDLASVGGYSSIAMLNGSLLC
ncbi:hypothetical protein QOZ80_5AG0388340 [Eleusine coracana subsp. coracana]|nr:hypothetical protein QOZ80_5AG0388340 [Eleusine coracana subsp. coracana]